MAERYDAANVARRPVPARRFSTARLTGISLFAGGNGCGGGLAAPPVPAAGAAGTGPASVADKVTRAANDLTNDLLRSNADNLRQANEKIRTEMERGVFDIEAVKQANAALIGTIEDSLRIADEGKRRRVEAEPVKMADAQRQTLAAATARPAASPAAAGGAP